MLEAELVVLLLELEVVTGPTANPPGVVELRAGVVSELPMCDVVELVCVVLGNVIELELDVSSGPTLNPLDEDEVVLKTGLAKELELVEAKLDKALLEVDDDAGVITTIVLVTDDEMELLVVFEATEVVLVVAMAPDSVSGKYQYKDLGHNHSQITIYTPAGERVTGAQEKGGVIVRRIKILPSVATQKPFSAPVKTRDPSEPISQRP